MKVGVANITSWLHHVFLQLISRLCGGKLEGDSVGSSQITFHPGAVTGGDFTADTKTAG